MKTYLLTGLALLAVSSARAELYRPGFRDRGYRGRTFVEVAVPVCSGGYCSTLSNYGTYPGYGSYSAGGLWLGALTGAIIGHNSGSLGHSTGRGAAIGAGVGLLLGAVAEANRPVGQTAPAPVTVAAPLVAPVSYVTPAAPMAAPAEATPLSAANGLFGR